MNTTLENGEWAVNTVLDGVTRKVVIVKAKQTQQKKSEYHTVINVNLARIGISLVQNFNEVQSKEFLFVTLSDL